MARKSDKKTIDEPDRDELAQLIADSLNKLNKDVNQVAFFLDGTDDAPTNLTDFISTGATMLDIAISNRPNGGIAVGRITELTGLEGSGKSLVAAHLLVSTQKRGGVAVLIDTENAVNHDFFAAVGLDTSKGKLLYVAENNVEKIFDYIVNIVERVRSADSDKLVTIVVDSLANASTSKELEADFSKEGYATDKAIIISKAMRKLTTMIGRERIALVFTNQLRHKMNAPSFSDPWTTSGGKALPFAASTRVRLAQTGKIKNSSNEVIGVQVKANIIKNRLGPPHRTAEFDIYFDRGIDDTGSWLKIMKEHNLVKQSGAWYVYDDGSGNDVKFQSKDFAKFLEEDPARKEKLYTQICEFMIMKYKTEKDPEAVQISEADYDE